MTVIDDYLATLDTPTHDTVAHMYDIARELAPDTTEELSYNMPALKYKGKGLLAIMANKDFMSLKMWLYKNYKPYCVKFKKFSN